MKHQKLILLTAMLIVALSLHAKAQITTQNETYKLDTLWDSENIDLLRIQPSNIPGNVFVRMLDRKGVSEIEASTGKFIRLMDVPQELDFIADDMVDMKLTRDKKYIVSLFSTDTENLNGILINDVATGKTVKYLKIQNLSYHSEAVVHDLDKIYIVESKFEKNQFSEYITRIYRYSFESNTVKLLKQQNGYNQGSQSLITSDGKKFMSYLLDAGQGGAESFGIVVYNTADDKLEKVITDPRLLYGVGNGIVELKPDKLLVFSELDTNIHNYNPIKNEFVSKIAYTQIPTKFPYIDKWPIFDAPKMIQKIDENLIFGKSEHNKKKNPLNIIQFLNLKTNNFLLEMYAGDAYYDQESSILFLMGYDNINSTIAIRITPKLTSTEPNHIENNGEKKFVLNYSIDDNTINVMLEDYTNIRNITLNNIQGIALYELNRFANNEIQFDITNYPKGTYFITVTTKDNQKQVLKINF
jgi:hypothetical protein